MKKVEIRAWAKVLGSKGGKIGGRTTGPSKRRGGAEYYAAIARKRWGRPKPPPTNQKPKEES